MAARPHENKSKINPRLWDLLGDQSEAAAALLALSSDSTSNFAESRALSESVRMNGGVIGEGRVASQSIDPQSTLATSADSSRTPAIDAAISHLGSSGSELVSIPTPQRPRLKALKVNEVEVIEPTQLSSVLQRIWIEILASDPGLDHPQLRPEFVLAVAEAGRPIEIAVLRSDGEVVGFFPFLRRTKTWAEPIAGPAADFEALIAYPEVECAIPALLRKCGLRGWTFAHLSAKQKHFAEFHAYWDEAPYLDLTAGYENYLTKFRERSRSTLSSIERKARKLEREVGTLSFEYQAVDLKSSIELLQNWKQHQLLRLGFDDMFQLPWISRLITRCTQHQTSEFRAVVSVLSAGTQPVAIHLGLQSRKILLSWIPAYHPEYQNYSAGAQLFLRIAQAAASEGVTRLDLGRGENQLKASLSSDAYDLAIGTAAASRSSAFLRNTALKLKRRIRANRWVYKLWQQSRIARGSQSTNS